MSKIIILTGDIAAGKSTFSSILAKRYNLESYNKDVIKEMLVDDIGFSDREDNLKLSRATVRLMTLIYEEHSAVASDLILEANFHRDELEKLYELAAANGDELLTIVFEADIDILFERFNHRVEFENRHPAHQSAGLDTLEAFRKYVSESRYEIAHEELIRVNANDFSYQKDEKLIEAIDRFMKNGRLEND